MSNQNDRISIVGGGPAGCLLACLLGRQGFGVDVYEKRPDLRLTGTTEGRSINLALSARGLAALAEINLDQPVLSMAVPMPGRIIHPLQGSTIFQAYGRTGTEAINSVSRRDLNAQLLDAAEKTLGVNIHFNSACTAFDLASNSATILDPSSGQTRHVSSGVMIGTDGSASVIRRAMQAQGNLVEDVDRLSHGYKELVIPALPDGGFRLEKNGLHIWPRKSFMMIALPNHDGSFTCTVFLECTGERSFQKLSTEPEVLAFFEEHFPDVIPLIPDLAKNFLRNPLGHLDTVMCGPWYKDNRVCLLGDAAHAIIPFYGQGLNCALQDVILYSQILSRSGGDFAVTHRAFFESRKPDADAISQLARGNFIEMRDRVSDPAFLLKKKLEHELERRFPERFQSTYARVTFNTGSYDEALQLGEISDRILYAACAGVSSIDEIDCERVLSQVEREVADRSLQRIQAGAEDVQIQPGREAQAIDRPESRQPRP